MDNNVRIEEEAGPAFLGIAYLSSLVFEKERVQKRSQRFWESRKKEYPVKSWMGVYFADALKERKFPPVFIANAGKQVGLGLFAGADIPALTLLGEYTGIVRRKPFGSTKKNFYSMCYPIGFFSVTSWIIDAEKQGNYTRFINHSQNANTQVKSLLYEGLIRMVFVTNRKVLKGEQILTDYGDLYWKQLGITPKELTC